MGDVQPAKCIPFTRVNPETEQQERMEMCVAIIDFLAHLCHGKGSFIKQKKTHVKVYDNAEKKFDESYGHKLTFLVADMFYGHNNKRSNFLNSHFIPESRMRHQLNALQGAVQYQKLVSKLRGKPSFDNFRQVYYHTCPQGVPNSILKLLFDISVLGLSERKQADYSTYAAGFNDKAGYRIEGSGWNNMEKTIAKVGVVGDEARQFGAAHLQEIYNKMKAYYDEQNDL